MLATDADGQHGHGRHPRGAGDAHGAHPRRRPAPRRRQRRRGPPALPLARRCRPRSARRAPAATPRSRSSWARPSPAPPRARRRCCSPARRSSATAPSPPRPERRRPVGPPAGDSAVRLPPHEGPGDPRHLPLLLRAAGAQDRALGLAGALVARPLGAADHRRHAALQALLPRPRGAARPPPRRRAEMLPHDRHRGGRQHRPPPHLLRDARQLELRRLLQGGVDPLGLGALDRRASAWTRSGSGSPSSAATRSSGSAPTRRRSQIWRGVGRARRADRPPRPRRQLLAGGADRPLRPLLGALPRPRRGVRRRRRAARRRHRPLPRVLEPRLHDLRPRRGRRPDRAADAQHRHRHGAGPDGGDPPGRPLGLRDRPAAAAGRPRRGAVRALLRGGRRGDPGDADRRRPLARRRLPDRRRRRPLQRGPRLHPAADHAAGDPAGPHARPRVALARPLRRAHDRDDGRGLPRAGRRARRRSPAGSATRRRASAAPWSAAPSCWSGWSPRRRRRRPPGSTPPTPSSSTTPTASPTT